MLMIQDSEIPSELQAAQNKKKKKKKTQLNYHKFISKNHKIKIKF
jgi:hypothetical protein